MMFSFIKETFACEVLIFAEKSDLYVGEEVLIKIERIKTHKTCVLPIEETEIQISNGEIVKESEWIEGTKDTKEIVVKFYEPGNQIIKITRDCPKGGVMIWTKEFNVLPLQVNENTTTMPPKEEETLTPLPSKETEPTNPSTSTNSSNLSEPTESADTKTPQISKTVEENIYQNEDESKPKDLTAQVEENIDQNLNNTKESTKDDLSKWLEAYLFNTQILFYIILMILSLIFISLKFYKLRFFTLIFSITILGFYFGGCLCPVSYIGKLFSSGFLSISFYIFLSLIIFFSIITLFKGRVFCGWVCPHGALQEFVYKIKTKKFEKIEKYFKYLKYIILIVVIIFSFIYSQNYICEVYPFKVLYNFSGTGFILAFALAILVFSIFIYRPFCRFICPFGAYLALISKLGEKLHLRKINISSSCIKCKKCLKECNANAIYEQDDCYKIDTKECFVCGDCETICPKNK